MMLATINCIHQKLTLRHIKILFSFPTLKAVSPLATWVGNQLFNRTTLLIYINHQWPTYKFVSFLKQTLGSIENPCSDTDGHYEATYCKEHVFVLYRKPRFRRNVLSRNTTICVLGNFHSKTRLAGDGSVNLS